MPDAKLSMCRKEIKSDLLTQFSFVVFSLIRVEELSRHTPVLNWGGGEGGGELNREKVLAPKRGGGFIRERIERRAFKIEGSRYILKQFYSITKVKRAL